MFQSRKSQRAAYELSQIPGSLFATADPLRACLCYCVALLAAAAHDNQKQAITKRHDEHAQTMVAYTGRKVFYPNTGRQQG
jgi:hypothetical protein